MSFCATFYFLSFCVIFCPFTPLTIRKIKILRTWKKQMEILSWCMVPEIWSATDRIFLSFLDRFLPFYHLNYPENQNFEKIKKPWRYHHFRQVHQKSWSHAILFLRYSLFFILGYFLCFYTPSYPINYFFKKMKKKTSSFYIIVPKIMTIWCTVPVHIVCDGQMDRQMDRQMDGQTEKVTHRGGCPT